MPSIGRPGRTLVLAAALMACTPFIIGAASDGEGSAGSRFTQLTVTGVGHDTQPASLLQISAGVESFSTDASQAMAENATKLDRIRTRLARVGVGKDDFRTSNLTLSPTERYEKNEHIKGFEVRHMLEVVFRKPTQAGSILDALVKDGVTNISGPSSYRDASPAAVDRARAEAIKDAMARADIYAKTLGMTVRRVVSIHDGSSYARTQLTPPAATFPSRRTTITPGQESVEVSIGTVFELSKP